MKAKPLTLSDELVAAVTQYMSKRPYSEAVGLMNALATELQPQYAARAEAAKPKKKPAVKPSA